MCFGMYIENCLGIGKRGREGMFLKRGVEIGLDRGYYRFLDVRETERKAFNPVQRASHLPDSPIGAIAVHRRLISQSQRRLCQEESSPSTYPHLHSDMDYEGFRQMVLGANLYTVKSAELSKFSGGLMDGNIDKTFNVLAIGNKKDTKPVIEMVDQVLSSELKPAVICNSFIEFKKRFNQLHTPPLQQENVNRLYSILKDQN